jgi:outer membrane protein
MSIQLYLPLLGKVYPYIGAGGNATIFWEKSGALDTLPLSNSIGPTLQIGTNINLSSYACLSIDIKWNMLRTDIQNNGEKIATLVIDPFTFGVGFGFRF